MELRHIRYFLAVAEEGNFTRAAQRLGLGQPPLSQQIKDLEVEVGAALFHRRPYGAELTEAGQAFRDAVRPLPERATQAVEAARRAALGESGVLTLGFTGTAVLHPLVPACIRAFRQRYPGVDLRLEEANSVALIAGLQAQRLDVAILRPSDSDPDTLQVQGLADEPLVAALPAAHTAAAQRSALDLQQLRGDAFILTPRAVGISLHDAVLQACRRAGFEARLGQPAPQIASILSLVSAELGVSLVPTSMRQLAIRGVVYRRLQAPVPRVRLAVAHLAQDPRPLARNFAAVALATAQGTAPAGETR